VKHIAIVAVPPLVAFGLVGAFFTAEALGFRPLSNEPANLSEAAATGAAAAALRFIGAGADPNLEYEIRSGVLGVLPRTVNAIDAAILGRREEMVSLLLQHGALPIDADRTRCLAEAVDLREALPLLDLQPPKERAARPEDSDDAIAACLGGPEAK
jgi:hypothetical protein